MRVLEASLDELRDSSLWQDLAPEAQDLRRMQIAFLKGDLEDLDRLRLEIQSKTGENQAALLSLLELKRALRQGGAGPMAASPKIEVGGILGAESLFILGRILEGQGKFRESQDSYRLATEAFRKSGSERRALRSIFNTIVAESKIDPHQKYLIEDYQFVVKKAEALGDLALAGAAHLNTSREYQRMGAREASLRYVQLAIDLMRGDTGSSVYVQAVAHRAHLFFELGRLFEFRADLQEVRISRIREAQDAVRFLETLEEGPSEEAREINTPTWSERALEHGRINEDVALSPQELKVIEILGQGPIGRIDLMIKIFGADQSSEISENRLKSLLGRLRKKRPDLIVFADGKYSLNDLVRFARTKKSA